MNPTSSNPPSWPSPYPNRSDQQVPPPIAQQGFPSSTAGASFSMVTDYYQPAHYYGMMSPLAAPPQDQTGSSTSNGQSAPQVGEASFAGYAAGPPTRGPSQQLYSGYDDPWQHGYGGGFVGYSSYYPVRAPSLQQPWLYGEPPAFCYQPQPPPTRWPQPYGVRCPTAPPSVETETAQQAHITSVTCVVQPRTSTLQVGESASTSSRVDHMASLSTSSEPSVSSVEVDVTGWSDLPLPAVNPAIVVSQPFTDRQYEELNKLYEEDKFPSVAKRRESAERIGLNFRQISAWFATRRRRDNLPTQAQPELTAEQLNELNKVLRENPVPTVIQRQALATKLGLPFARVSNWFGSKRILAENNAAAAPSSVTTADNSPVGETKPVKPPEKQPSKAPIIPGQPVVDESEFEKFSQHQVDTLVESYNEQKYPTMETRIELGDRLGIPTTTVTAWFINRRSKEKPQTVRRRRPELTTEQVEALQTALHTNPTPTLEERQELATRLGLSFARVSGWFGTQRPSMPPSVTANSE